jgi:hypothetical protein
MKEKPWWFLVLLKITKNHRDKFFFWLFCHFLNGFWVSQFKGKNVPFSLHPLHELVWSEIVRLISVLTCSAAGTTVSPPSTNTASSATSPPSPHGMTAPSSSPGKSGGSSDDSTVIQVRNWAGTAGAVVKEMWRVEGVYSGLICLI